EQLQVIEKELEAARAQREIVERTQLETHEVSNPDSVDAVVTLIAESGDRTMLALLENLRRAETELNYIEERAGPNHWQAKQLRTAFTVARRKVDEYAWNFDLARLPNAVQSLST